MVRTRTQRSRDISRNEWKKKYTKGSDHEKEVISSIRTFLNIIETIRGSKNKETICSCLFKYLSEHKGFIFAHRKLDITIRTKMFELRESEDWRQEAEKYWREIYGTKMPSKYRESCLDL
jgi:hypothetical protein